MVLLSLAEGTSHHHRERVREPLRGRRRAQPPGRRHRDQRPPRRRRRAARAQRHRGRGAGPARRRRARHRRARRRRASRRCAACTISTGGTRTSPASCARLGADVARARRGARTEPRRTRLSSHARTRPCAAPDGAARRRSMSDVPRLQSRRRRARPRGERRRAGAARCRGSRASAATAPARLAPRALVALGARRRRRRRRGRPLYWLYGRDAVEQLAGGLRHRQALGQGAGLGGVRRARRWSLAVALRHRLPRLRPPPRRQAHRRGRGRASCWPRPAWPSATPTASSPARRRQTGSAARTQPSRQAITTRTRKSTPPLPDKPMNILLIGSDKSSDPGRPRALGHADARAPRPRDQEHLHALAAARPAASTSRASATTR